MANVTATTGWVSGVVGSEIGSLSITIDSGSNRKLIILYIVENNTSPEPISLTVGGVAYTEKFEFHPDVTGSPDHHLYFFVWNEAAIQSMVGTTVSYSDASTQANEIAAYGVVENTNQANIGSAADSDTNNNATQLVLTTTSSVNDLVLVIGRHDSDAATVTFTGVSEIFDTTGNSFGVGQASSVTIDWSASDACSALAIVLPHQAAASGRTRLLQSKLLKSDLLSR